MIDGHDPPQLDLNRLKAISALGRGAKGVVFLVQNKDDDKDIFALKVICKAAIEKKKKDRNDGSEYKRICFERDVLKMFDHPLLPRLRGTVVTNKVVGYAIDYCPGRDLSSLRKKQTEKTFSDDIIRFYAAELVLALEYLHGLGIVYRDLKPENVMIQENGHLMLVDFDLSIKLAPKTTTNSPKKTHTPTLPLPKPVPKKKIKKSFSLRFCNSGITPEIDSSEVPPPVDCSTKSADSVEKSNSFVGTEEYVAPEIISGTGHDFSVDWWCLGIVLHEMLYGVTPFRGLNRKETFYRVLTKTPELIGEATPLRDLIRKLLEKDPRVRISLEEIKSHGFFAGVCWDSIVRLARPPFIPTQYEDFSGNDEEIEVEGFVHNVFEIAKEDTLENNHKYSQIKRNQDFVSNNDEVFSNVF